MALWEITLLKLRPRAARTLVFACLANAPSPLVSDPAVLIEALSQPVVERRAVCPAPARRVTIYSGPWLFGQNDQIWHPSHGVFPRVAGLLALQLVRRLISTRDWPPHTRRGSP